jgi:uncharacterized membrane protein YccF (DUF307 family)
MSVNNVGADQTLPIRCCHPVTRPYRATNIGREDVGSGPLGVIGNIIWLTLGHLVTAILLAVTIVGIPFAWARLKLAGLALWPIGKAIVPVQT